MYHTTISKDDLTLLIGENPGLWAIGERTWGPESYAKILSGSSWENSLPHVFFIRDPNRVLEHWDTIAEIYLFNSSVQFHLIRDGSQGLIFSENRLEHNADRLKTFQSILRESSSRYRFALEMNVFAGMSRDRDDMVKYLYDASNNDWRLYHE